MGLRAIERSVDLYTDYLISSTGQVLATGLSRLYAGAISYDHVIRLLTNQYLDSTDLWSKAKPLIRRTEQARNPAAFSVLIVDDTNIEKPHTDESAFITSYWDGPDTLLIFGMRQKRYVKGVNLLTLLYQLGELSLPISA